MKAQPASKSEESGAGRGMRQWSVRARVMTSILLVAAFGLIGAGGLAFLVQRDRLITQIDDRLLSKVDTARFVVTGEPQSDTSGGNVPAASTSSFATVRDALEAVVGRVLPGRNESSLGILDGRATFVPPVQVDFRLDELDALVDRVVGEVADASVKIGTFASPTGTLRYVATPVTTAGDPTTAIYLAAIDLDAELGELTAVFGTYSIVAAVALLTIGLVGWVVAGRLLAPIRNLRIAASRITASTHNERIPVVGRDDVSELTRTVNGMLDRLDVALTSQRQLLDDVRHELKTPITIVRGNLELLDPTRASEVEATRHLAIEELDRMAGLVDDIESLAQSQLALPDRAPTDIANLTADVFAKARGISGHRWNLASTAQSTVDLDPARITQAWLQLADNAAKFSPSGSVISIGSSMTEAAVEFWVEDTGPGIPEDSRERIFERFGRADTGRGVAGSGLGLAIVRAIAISHGGSVSLQSGPSGSRFAIVVPQTARPSQPNGVQE